MTFLKKYLIIIGVIFLAINTTTQASFANAETTNKASAETTDKKTIKVTAHGLVCSFCAQGIKAHFKQYTAIDKIEINLTHKMIVIAEKESKTLSNETIEKAIKDAGFKLIAIERTGASFETVVTDLK